MTKNIHKILLTVALAAATPMYMIAEPMIEIVNFAIDPENPVGIEYSNGTINVSGASGMTLYIYNVAGVCVHTSKIDADYKRVDVGLSKGCYIVKVGKVVRKISIV